MVSRKSNENNETGLLFYLELIYSLFLEGTYSRRELTISRLQIKKTRCCISEIVFRQLKHSIIVHTRIFHWLNSKLPHIN